VGGLRNFVGWFGIISSEIYLLPVQYKIFAHLLDEGQTFSNHVNHIKQATVLLLPVLEFFVVDGNIGGLCTGQS
jgi:hypothetical protein